MNIRPLNFVAALFAIIAAGCASDSITPQLFVREIISRNCYRDHFNYEGGHLISFQRFFGNREACFIKFSYAGDKLVKIHSVQDNGVEQLTELTYGEDGNRQFEKTTTSSNGEAVQLTGMFAYHDGKIQSVRYYGSDVNIVDEKQFFWEGDNIKRIDSFTWFNRQRSSVQSRIFNYDNKSNYSNQDIAFCYLPGIAETVLCRNNVVSVTSNESDRSTAEYTFSYNTNAYPVAYIYKWMGQSFSPIEIEYY